MPLLWSLRLFGFCSTTIPLRMELILMKPFLSIPTRGVLAKYAAHVTSASFGAVTDMDLKL